MKKMICPVTFQGAGPCVCACMRACVCGGGGVHCTDLTALRTLPKHTTEVLDQQYKKKI